MTVVAYRDWFKEQIRDRPMQERVKIRDVPRHNFQRSRKQKYYV